MATAHPKPNHPRFVDREGLIYGRLTVLSYAGGSRWKCQCECGTVKEIAGHTLGRLVNSCGCLQRELASARMMRHGHARKRRTTPEFLAWQGLIDRCTNRRAAQFPHYGGRGITVCDRWRHSFEAFLADMGTRPGRGYSLDRIDVNGPYAPENCRWATQSEQMRNTRRNRLLTCRGETKTLAEWAEIAGVDRYIIKGRLRLGWTDEAAVFTPVREIAKRGR